MGALLLAIFANCGEKAPNLKPYGEKVQIPPLNPPPRSYWPTNGWKTKSLKEAGWKEDKISALEEYAFTIEGTEEDRLGTRTDAVVIVHKGFIVYERYARGYKSNDKHLIWSIAKSYTNALVGRAIEKGLLKLDDPAYLYVPELAKTEDHKKITIRHLMTMTSGLAANEGYESNPLNSTVVAMLYTMGRSNMGAYISNLPLRAEPGTRVYYSSGDTNILTYALKNIYDNLANEKYEDMPWKELFSPLGIQDITFERDGSGVFVGSSYIYTTPRDLAKFGYLYLNDGIWEGKRLLSSDWIVFTRTPSMGYQTTKPYIGFDKDIYTAQWYANTGVPDVGIPKPLPDAPEDTFYASGHWGQRLYVIPSKDLVVVRVGDDRDVKYFDNNKFLKLILESM